mmetsp:Transcript_108192/g.161863  ORF Transcript_108192/g.161863 Transcript_108192/m.161863 type:complete len:112 (-) Transcript_108192:174-509(-)
MTENLPDLVYTLGVPLFCHLLIPVDCQELEILHRMTGPLDIVFLVAGRHYVVVGLQNRFGWDFLPSFDSFLIPCFVVDDLLLMGELRASWTWMTKASGFVEALVDYSFHLC